MSDLFLDSNVSAKSMPERTEAPCSGVEATYKAREVEGVFDLYFYRPIGFWLAQFFARLKMTPAGVSLLAGIFGVVAGHLYYLSRPKHQRCRDGAPGLRKYTR